MLKNIEDVDHYVASQPEAIQDRLEQLRRTIKAAAPEAEETISYGMPFYKLKGRLVYFAAHQHHIGLYPMASGIANFQKELSKYQTSKGTVQFPFDKPMPIGLIKKIIQFRVKENLSKTTSKTKK